MASNRMSLPAATVIAFFALALFLPAPTRAANCCECAGVEKPELATEAACKTACPNDWLYLDTACAVSVPVNKPAEKNVTASPASGKLESFNLPTGDVTTVIGRVIRALLGISGSISLAMIIYGGFLWLTSAGAPETITKAKNIVVWASLGLVIIFASYALVSAVFDVASKAAGIAL